MSLDTRVSELERRVSALEGLSQSVVNIDLNRQRLENEYGFAVDDSDWHAYIDRQLGAENGVGKDEAAQAAELRRRMDRRK